MLFVIRVPDAHDEMLQYAISPRGDDTPFIGGRAQPKKPLRERSQRSDDQHGAMSRLGSCRHGLTQPGRHAADHQKHRHG